MKELVSESWNGTTLRLRFSYQSKRYTLTVPGKTQHNKDLRNLVIKKITDDISNQKLDITLEKYKSVLNTIQTSLPFKQIATLQPSLPELFKKYLNTTGTDLESSLHHYATYQMMLRWQDKPGEQLLTVDTLPVFLNNETISASTFNKRKTHLKRFYDYLQREGYIKYNLISDLKSRKLPKAVPDHHKPFNEEEVKTILEAFKSDRYSIKRSAFNHSHYYLFIKFIFDTGVRVGEACTLRVKDLDFSSQRAHIHTAWGGTTVKWKKVKSIKSTKTETSRYVSMSAGMTRDLKLYTATKKPEDLVFTGPRGSIIDSNNFNDRVFFKILEQLHIPKRVVYAGRHTFVSLAVKQKVDLPSLQYQLGHSSINTTIRHYNEHQTPPELYLKRPTDDN